MNTQSQMSNAELSSALKSERSKAKAAEVFCVICGIGMAALMFMGKFLFGMLMILPIILFALLMLKHLTAIKSLISGNIVKGVLEEVFENVTYAPEYCLSDEIIHSAHMAFPEPYEEVIGNDFIDADYKGLHLKMSDIELRRKVSSYDAEKDSWDETEQKVFEGPWLVCDFGKELSGEVHLSEITKSTPSVMKKARIRMENEIFNEHFIVTADDPEEAFYILTPHMMDYILNVMATHEGVVYMSFLRDGKLHVAVNSGSDLFELGKNDPDPENLRQVFLKEVHWYTDIIDELRLEPNLYK